MQRYYLAYGSNLDRGQMACRCPHAQAVGTAWLKGWRLVFRGRGAGNYLTIEPAPGLAVPVAVWAVTKADEEALDRYEDYPAFYRKEPLPITYKDLKTGEGRRVMAFMYLMNGGYPAGLPTAQYMDTCAAGYRDFGFAPQALLDAQAYTGEVMALEKGEGQPVAGRVPGI